MKIVFRHDTFEKWKEVGTVPEKDEIIIIEYDNGRYRVALGDGKTPGYLLPKMKKFPCWIEYENFSRRLFARFKPYKRQKGEWER